MKYVLFFLTVFCFSCNQQDESADTISLANFFTASNWMVTNDSDTVYLYISPVNEVLVNTCQYRMEKGDSVETVASSIQPGSNWQFMGRDYALQSASDSVLRFRSESGEALWKRISDAEMELQTGEAQYLFRKSLPLSTFLVRKKYDHLHGTSTADSCEVAP